MALAFDSVTSGSPLDFSVSNTFSFTNTAGDFMWVLAANDRSGSGTTIDSITYNGVALTLQTALGAGGRATRMGHLASPATGANNVVVTNSSINTKPMAIAASYSGTDTASPVSGVQTLNTTTTDDTFTVATASGDFVVGGAIATSGSLSYTPGTNTNERVERDFTGVGSGWGGDEPGAAGSVTINETHTSAVSGGYAFSLKAAASGPTAAQIMAAAQAFTDAAGMVGRVWK